MSKIEKNIIYSLIFNPLIIENNNNYKKEIISEFLKEIISLHIVNYNKNDLYWILNEIIDNSIKYSLNKYSKIYLDFYNIQDSYILNVRNYTDTNNMNKLLKCLEDLQYENDNYLNYYTNKFKDNSAGGVGLLLLYDNFKIIPEIIITKIDADVYNIKSIFKFS